MASAGETGDILDLRLREGQVHTADGGLEFVLEVLERAERHLCGNAAVRFDAGYPGEPLMAALEERGTHYVARVRNNAVSVRSSRGLASCGFAPNRDGTTDEASPFHLHRDAEAERDYETRGVGTIWSDRKPRNGFSPSRALIGWPVRGRASHPIRGSAAHRRNVGLLVAERMPPTVLPRADRTVTQRRAEAPGAAGHGRRGLGCAEQRRARRRRAPHLGPRVVLTGLDRGRVPAGSCRSSLSGPGELIPRCFWLLTSMPSEEMSGEDLLALYRKRGKAEGHLGELMSVVSPALSSTSRRKSHYRGKKIAKREKGVDPFACNQVRLLLAGFGYQIMHVQRALLERATGTGWSLRRLAERGLATLHGPSG